MTQYNKQSGFTLVEMLISLFVFALISVGTMTALTNSVRGKAQVAERIEGLQNIEAARALLKSDFTNITLRPVRDAYGSEQPYLLSGGVSELIDFTRTGRPNPGGLEKRGDLQRVSYHFEDGQLIRRSLAQDNPAPRTPIVERVLLDDLRFARLEFISGEQQASQLFLSVRDTGPVTLDGVELELEFDNGDRLTQFFELAL